MCCGGPVNTLAWTEARKPAWNLPPVQLTPGAFLLLGFSPRLLGGETLLCSGQAASASPLSSVPGGVPKKFIPWVAASCHSLYEQLHCRIMEAKVLEAKPRVWLKKGGWKTSSPIFPLSHLSCLAEILPNPLSSKGNIVFIYRRGQGQESHSWNAEAAMQEFSPWSQDKRWGGGGWDPHTTDGIFLLCSIKSCIRSDFSKEHFPTLFPFNFPLVTLQVICTGPVIQLSISWSIASLIVAPVYLFIFLKQPVLHP